MYIGRKMLINYPFFTSHGLVECFEECFQRHSLVVDIWPIWLLSIEGEFHFSCRYYFGSMISWLESSFLTKQNKIISGDHLTMWRHFFWCLLLLCNLFFILFFCVFMYWDVLDEVALIIIFYFSLLSYTLQGEDNIEHLCLTCTKLHQALGEGNMLGKRFKRRNILLKTLYKLVDIDSDPLSLKLAKIFLAVSVLKCSLVDCEAQNHELQLAFNFSFHTCKLCLN